MISNSPPTTSASKAVIKSNKFHVSLTHKLKSKMENEFNIIRTKLLLIADYEMTKYLKHSNLKINSQLPNVLANKNSVVDGFTIINPPIDNDTNQLALNKAISEKGITHLEVSSANNPYKIFRNNPLVRLSKKTRHRKNLDPKVNTASLAPMEKENSKSSLNSNLAMKVSTSGLEDNSTNNINISEQTIPPSNASIIILDGDKSINLLNTSKMILSGLNNANKVKSVIKKSKLTEERKAMILLQLAPKKEREAKLLEENVTKQGKHYDF